MASRVGNYLKQHHLALLCLFLVVGGGTAWALERNSVKSRHIANGEVKPADLGIPGTFIDAGLPDAFGGCSAQPELGWQDWSPDVNRAAGYYRAPDGIVHVRGTVAPCGADENPVVTLPLGFRPNRTEYFAATNPLSRTANVYAEVLSNGMVRTTIPAPSLVSLDGITFRCGPSGQDGCP